MSTVNKKKTKQVPPPSIRVYFVDNGELRDIIEADAKKFGVSTSIMANMYIKAGRPLVVKTLDSMNKKAKSMS